MVAVLEDIGHMATAAAVAAAGHHTAAAVEQEVSNNPLAGLGCMAIVEDSLD